MLNKLILFLVLCFFSLNNLATGNTIKSIKIKDRFNQTNINFSSNKPFKWRAFTLKNPNRIVVDIYNVNFTENIDKIKFNKKIILKIRKGLSKSGTLRIVFDTKENIKYKTNAKSNTKNLNLRLSLKKDKPHKIKIVVIDPGHGGKDPGAIGQSGTKEKDVVLSIAKKLEKLINNHPNMKAVLTRNSDKFISLRRRLQIARNSKADLFIAIHADSYFNNNASGASIYSLSNHGASSVTARWLAQKENHSELGSVNLAGLEDQSMTLRSVLLDLAQTATHKASLRLGTSLLDSLSSVTKLHYSRVERAPFMVLKHPDIPSILIETGFISNKKEERRLKDNNHQQKLAMAIYKGINTSHLKYISK
ncbi:N-acetylmuramoyl-L-alanine amidase [Gammaproteobacteria bacterium]|nr:N-acetylmuramoyl-L-alanine amidase [Gammaproteobacteria bacterium]